MDSHQILANVFFHGYILYSNNINILGIPKFIIILKVKF